MSAFLVRTSYLLLLLCASLYLWWAVDGCGGGDHRRGLAQALALLPLSRHRRRVSPNWQRASRSGWFVVRWGGTVWGAVGRASSSVITVHRDVHPVIVRFPLYYIAFGMAISQTTAMRCSVFLSAIIAHTNMKSFVWILSTLRLTSVMVSIFNNFSISIWSLLWKLSILSYCVLCTIMQSSVDTSVAENYLCCLCLLFCLLLLLFCLVRFLRAL